MAENEAVAIDASPDLEMRGEGAAKIPTPPRDDEEDEEDDEDDDEELF